MGPAATAIQLWQDATLPRVPKYCKRYFTWFTQRMMERADKKCSQDARNRDACVYVVVAQKPV
ncbi:hypothetical protein TBK1r_18430 [Stieleria magnilauensis]|uniref:Uncharacterized protein n=2 Tax=Stieleria magnilauensis TaxID=2527963 RepID=A0ABX5XNG7_9BACT|nr:hypothetical protein TBK1r_18430 [Planctomycetes bacterium TBK1r]